MKGMSKLVMLVFVLCTLSIISVSSFAQLSSPDKTFDKEKKIVTIKDGASNVIDVQLVSSKKHISGNKEIFETIFRLNPYSDVIVDSDKFKFTGVHFGGKPIDTMNYYIIEEKPTTTKTITKVCNPYEATEELPYDVVNDTQPAPIKYIVQNCTYVEGEMIVNINQTKKFSFNGVFKGTENSFIKVVSERLLVLNRQVSDVLPIFYSLNLDEFVLWSSGWKYRDDTLTSDNLSTVANIPYVVNGTGGFDIDGSQQYVWAKGEAINGTQRLWYDDSSTYEMTNLSNVTVPFEVESGGGASVNATELYSDEELVHLRFGTNDSIWAYDSTKYGNNGTYNNTNWTDLGYVYGGGIVPAQSVSGVHVPRVPSFNVENFTMNVWIKPDTNTGRQNILALKDSAKEDDILLEISKGATGDVSLLIDNSGSFTYCTSAETPVASGSWQMITATYANATKAMRVYHNGRLLLECTSTPSLPIGIDAGGFYVGVRPYYDGNFKYGGLIDEASLLNKTLSESEVLALYQSVSMSSLGDEVNTNSPPSTNTVTASPTIATIETPINVTVTATDEADTVFNITTKWYKNGVIQSGNTTTYEANNNTATQSNLSVATSSLVKGDNWTAEAYATDQSSASSTYLNSSTVFVSKSFVMREQWTSGKYLTDKNNLDINLTITNDTGVAVFALYAEFNSTNLTMNRVNDTVFNLSINISSREMSDGNYTIKFFAEDSRENETNITLDTWAFIDNGIPDATLTKVTEGDGFILPSYINITANTTEPYLDRINVSVYRGDGTFNFSFEYSANTSIEINLSGSDAVGNYTVNMTVNDTTGNINSSVFSWGVGKINITENSILIVKNYTNEPTAWGNESSVVNNSMQNLTTQINLSVTADGFLDAQTRRIDVNLSGTYPNWTMKVVLNSTSGTVAHTNSSDNITFTSEPLSTGNIKSMFVEVTTFEALNYSFQQQSGSTYNYLISTDISKSFNEYIKFVLPSIQQFAKDTYHPRYFVCRGTVTRASYGCSQFTTAVDVESINNGANSKDGYPVNLKAYDSTDTITDLSMQTNHSDFLIQINIVSGAYQSGSSSTSSSSSGGGGGSSYVPPITAEATAEIEAPICPEGFTPVTITENGEQKVVCQAEVPPSADRFFSFFTSGNISPIIVIALLLVVGAFLTQTDKGKNILKKGKVS